MSRNLMQSMQMSNRNTQEHYAPSLKTNIQRLKDLTQNLCILVTVDLEECNKTEQRHRESESISFWQVC